MFCSLFEKQKNIKPVKTFSFSFLEVKKKSTRHINSNKLPVLWINLSDVQLNLEQQELFQLMLKVTYMIYNMIQ